MTFDSSSTWKRRRFDAVSSMESELANEKLAAAKEKYGRDIRVFETSIASETSANVSDMGETDDFYEFTADDYYRLLATKKKAVIRVRFPDNHTLEALFHPSETIQSLADLLQKVVARPELSFCLYTTPPKKQIKDMSQDLYTAGFVPGAIVYFAYEAPKGGDGASSNGPFLQEEVMSLKGLEFVAHQVEASSGPAQEPESTSVPKQTDQKLSDKKKMAKPKWLKM